MNFCRGTLLAGVLLAIPAAGPAAGQVPIDLSTESDPVLLRFSNPWTTTRVEPTFTEDAGRPQVVVRSIRPMGRIVNAGRAPIRVVLFLQRPVGFGSGQLRVEQTTRGRLLVAAEGEVVTIGREDRPVWVTGIVPAGAEADLEAFEVPAPDAVVALLAEPRVQTGVLVAAARGNLLARVHGLAPPGAHDEDPTEYGFLFPYGVFLTGTHDLPGAWFAIECAGEVFRTR